MNQLPFPCYDMAESDIQMILTINDEIKNRCSASFDFDFTFDFKKYDSFSYNDVGRINPVISLNNNKSYFAFVETSYTLSTASRGGNRTYNEFQLWGIVLLKKDYGHLLIRTETFLDKVRELIAHVELNFEDDKEFSKKFYVLANDKTKAELLITQSFRNLIQKIKEKEFIIEIVESKLIIGNKKIPDIQSTLCFLDFMKKVSLSF